MLDRALILIVEDDDALRNRLAQAFEARGLEARTAGSIAEAQQIARQDPPEMVVLDLRVGADNGLDFVTVLKQIDPATRIVVLTGYGSVATAVQAVRRGAVQYLTKPADADEILAAFADTDVRSASPPRAQPMSLDRVEWEHINRVLADCGGNVSEAARLLGLHRRTLQRKLSKFPARR